MKLNWKRIAGVSLAVVVLVAAAVSVAFAQDSSQTKGLGLGKRWLGKGPGGFMLGYLRGKTGVDLKTLLDELKSGKTLDEIASEYGLDLTAIRDEVAANAPRAIFQGLDKETAAILSYIAKKTGTDVQVLVEEYKGGKTLEAIASEQGLDLAAIKEEIAACLAAAKQNKNAWGVLCYIAGKANVDLKALVEEFQNGKSLQDIAAEYGVDLSAVQAAIDAAKGAVKPGFGKACPGVGFGIGPKFRGSRGNGQGNSQNGQGKAQVSPQVFKGL